KPSDQIFQYGFLESHEKFSRWIKAAMAAS
ncbi:MAG: hypothetical protein ACI85S_000767, partial [Pseudohongiellaceae bacterium]